MKKKIAGFDFHIRAIREMLRVCREVRIFPVVDLDASQAEMISDVINEFKKTYDVEILEGREGNRPFNDVKCAISYQ